MKHNNFIKHLNRAYNQIDDCNIPVLLKYTKTISCDLDEVIYNLSDKSKIIYMNFPNKGCYVGIGECLSMKINSKEELKNLKNKKYNVVSNTKKSEIPSIPKTK